MSVADANRLRALELRVEMLEEAAPIAPGSLAARVGVLEEQNAKLQHRIATLQGTLNQMRARAGLAVPDTPETVSHAASG